MCALQERHDALTVEHLTAGFQCQGRRIPLFNPQRGIFKPRQMRYLLSVHAGYPRPGRHLWYDDQREVHRQLFEAEDRAVDYTFSVKVGRDTVWTVLREAGFTWQRDRTWCDTGRSRRKRKHGQVLVIDPDTEAKKGIDRSSVSGRRKTGTGGMGSG